MAYNWKLWAYETGHKGRQEMKIIRFLKDKSGESKVPPNNHSQSGKEKSALECGITNLHIADLAVVVVGEFLSEEFTSMNKTKPIGKKLVFDSTKHTTLPPFADARVLVRRLSEEDTNLLICMKTMALADFCCFQRGWKSKLFTIASGLRGIGSADKPAKP